MNSARENIRGTTGNHPRINAGDTPAGGAGETATGQATGLAREPGAGSAAAPVRFGTKIAVLLREDLPGWQRLNVTAFLVSGLGTAHPEVIGEPYADADGGAYLPMFRQPVLIFQGPGRTLAAARAQGRGLSLSVFTAELFGTGNDRDNRAAVRACAAAELDLVGLGVYGPRNAVDRALKGARKHP